MYDVLLGKQRGLVFPVMCNGGVVIDYHRNVPSYNPNNATDVGSVPSEDITDAHIGYGLWANQGSFTLEAIITPYDINGYGKISSATQPTITSSEKIMPSNSHNPNNVGLDKFQSEIYLSGTNRLSHEMTIFSNYNTDDTARFWFGLVNTTLHNENQPAEYKLRARITINNVTETFDSPICITPNYLRRFKYNANNLQTFDEDGMGGYQSIGSLTSHSGADLNNTNNDYTTTNLFDTDRLEVFYRSGFAFESLGTIKTATASKIELTQTYSPTLSNGTELFIRSYAEPTYINETFHVACVFNSTTNSITLFLDGKKLFSNKHTEISLFTFAPTDCKIGQALSHIGFDTARLNKQFMGEIHEMSMMDIARKNFIGTFNLLPNYENTLFYYRFEEVDL